MKINVQRKPEKAIGSKAAPTNAELRDLILLVLVELRSLKGGGK